MSTSVKSREDMDARIRARRARVRAETVKRRQRRTLSLFFLVLVAGGVAVALRSPLFEISAIEVRGVGAERARVVRQAAAIHEGQHLLTAPLAEAQAAVERLAWVRTVTVHRVPPSTVAVDITPRIPLLTVETPGAAWKVDEEAVVVDGGRVAGAPVITVGALHRPALGAAIQDRTVRDAVRVHVRLPAWLRDQVVTYRVAAPRDLWLRLAVPTEGEGEGARERAGGRGTAGEGARERVGGRGTAGEGARERVGGRGTAGEGARERAGGREAAGEERAGDGDSGHTTVDVRLGTAADLALKAEVIRVLLPQAVEERRHLDVRAPTNPVVVDSRPAAPGSG